jgi:hypothetical protein
MSTQLAGSTLILCLWSCASYSQSQSETLDLARSLRNNGNTAKSISILNRYVIAHPDDFNGYWLLGETLYWAKDFAKGRDAYRNAIRLAPDNLYLKLDFARVLLNTRKFGASKKLLQQLTQYKETKDAALTELSRLYYWTGHVRKAKHTLKKVGPSNSDIAKLRDEIDLAGALALTGSGSYSTDTQPLKAFNVGATASIAVSPILSPAADVTSSTFIKENNETSRAMAVALSNKFTLAATGTSLALQAGYFVFPGGNEELATYRLVLDQSIFRSVKFRFASERRPYLSTLASLDQAMATNVYQSYLEFGNENTFNGRVAYGGTKFEDDNVVNSYYAYVLTRGFGPDKMKIAFGYVYAFSDSRNDRFVPEQPWTWSDDGTIMGVYDPYFTPAMQSIHGCLVNLRFRFTNRFTIGANANVAFFATTSNPYLYVIQKGNALTLVKDFATIRYTPYEINAFSTIKLRGDAFIRIDYNFSSTFFYQRNHLKLTLGGFYK